MMLLPRLTHRSIPPRASQIKHRRAGMLVFAFCMLALLLPAQTTGVFSNQTSSIMDDAISYDPGNYPSKIEVTGMPGRLHGFAVRFMLLTGTFPDLDILLEAPNGQRIWFASSTRSVRTWIGQPCVHSAPAKLSPSASRHRAISI